jgi:hypothetical protein
VARKKKPPLSTVVAFMSDDIKAKAEARSRQENEPQETTKLSLASILPDPGQPRRLLPHDLAEAVTTGSLSSVEAMREWLRRIDTAPAGAALRRNMQEVKRLADSIAQHGLISPISVRQLRPDETLPAEIAYLIVTGERRYWAQVYLVSQGREIHEGDTVADPAEIKVTITSPGVTIRAHQLIENLLREDINAVERARGLWALRYELSGLDNPPASGETQGEPEEDQPAGVNHGSPPAEDQPNLVPWRQVEEALGISKRYRIFMTSVLNLSSEALDIVASHNLAERTIRPIVQKLKDRPDLQIKALTQLVTWHTEAETSEKPTRSITASVKELVEQLLVEETREEVLRSRSTRSVSSAPVIRFQTKVRQTLDFLNRLRAADRAGLSEALSRDEFADIRIDLRNLRQQIDKILESTGEVEADTTDQPEGTESPAGSATEST